MISYDGLLVQRSKTSSGGHNELGNQRKDIRCAEEQSFKQLMQLRLKPVDSTKKSEHMSPKAGIGTFPHNQCNEEESTSK